VTSEQTLNISKISRYSPDLPVNVCTTAKWHPFQNL